MELNFPVNHVVWSSQGLKDPNTQMYNFIMFFIF